MSALLKILTVPVLAALLLSLALLGLVAAERASAPSGTPSSPVFQLTNHDNGNGKSQDDKTQPVPPRHCTDGKGKDGEKNKHCQISQG